MSGTAGLLGNLGNWYDTTNQVANPLADYAARMRAAQLGAPAASPLAQAYTAPAYQTAGPHVDVNAVIAALKAAQPAAPAAADPIPGAADMSSMAPSPQDRGVGTHDFSTDAGQDNGFNGKSANGKDFLGHAFGGITGNLYSLGKALFAPPLAPAPTPLALPSSDTGGALSAGNIEINPVNAGGAGLGALAGTTADPATINGALGDITGQGPAGDTMGGGPQGPAGPGGMNADQGDRTSEARGFKAGGYTGNGPRNQVAGVVHGQEEVLSAPATKAVGRKTLSEINNADPKAVALAKKVADRIGARNDHGAREKR